MPRAAGQIDRAKNEAILDAAAEILSERGLSAPMALIARRACVSKQTIYNHYGAKIDLIQALVQRRVQTLTAPLIEARAEDNPEDALTAFASILLRMLSYRKGYGIMRLSVQSSGDMPDLAKDIFQLGPRTTLNRLEVFMQTEMDKGRIEKGNAMEAAEMFAGMAAGHKHVAAIMGCPVTMEEESIDALARRVAQRFLRAYAPQ
jgi:TetR/AcrR family transcriptional repressor of mexJK operon